MRLEHLWEIVNVFFSDRYNNVILYLQLQRSVFTTDCNRFVIIPRHESVIQSFPLIVTDIDTKCRVVETQILPQIFDCYVQTNFNYKSRDENFIKTDLFFIEILQNLTVPRTYIGTKVWIRYQVSNLVQKKLKSMQTSNIGTERISSIEPQPTTTPRSCCADSKVSLWSNLFTIIIALVNI